MKVNHFAIHQIQKDKHRTPELKLKKVETILYDEENKLTQSGSLIKEFVESAATMFDKQRSGKIYADIKRDSNTFDEQLQRYINNDINFMDFSCRLANELVKTIKQAPLATGGFMAIAEYTASPRKLIILMIRQEEGFAVDPVTLELQQSIQLDLTTINVGALIDLEKFRDQSEGQLELVRGIKEISKYFREFIGVLNFKSPETETNEFKTILDAYLHENSNKYGKEKRNEIKRLVANHIIDQKSEATSLIAVASIVNPEDPDHFHEYANKQGVSAEFNGAPKLLKNWQRFRFVGPKLTIEFDKGLVKDGKITHRKDDKNELALKLIHFPELESKLKDIE